MKTIWFAIIVISIVFALLTGNIDKVTDVLLFDLQRSVDLILSLLPIMAFWTGLMRIVEKSGFLNNFTKLIRPIVKFLFKEVNNDNKTVNTIVMTILSNMLGIGNSATAFGIKSMEQMQTLNKNKQRASDAMCMFVIINVSSIQLIPITVIKLRADSGAAVPSDILVPTLLATSISTIVALTFAKYYEKGEVQWNY